MSDTAANTRQRPRCVVMAVVSYRVHPTRPDLRIVGLSEHGDEIEDCQVVTGDHYHLGQKGFFIPEGAIVPDNIAEDLRVKGRLAGKKRNRVKAKDMDGFYSDGLFYGSQFCETHDEHNHLVRQPRGWDHRWVLGQDVAEEVGIV